MSQLTIQGQWSSSGWSFLTPSYLTDGSDATYLSSSNSQNGTIECGFIPPPDTIGSGDITLTIRAGKDSTGGHSRNLTVSLVESGVTMWTQYVGTVNTATTYVYTVTTPPSDWSIARVRFTSGGTVSTGTRRSVRVHEFGITLPDAGPPPDTPPSTSVWNGSSWVTGQAKVWTGSAWSAGQIKMWNGTDWE